MRIIFLLTELLMLGLWIQALVAGAPGPAASLWGVMLFAVVPFMTLEISIIHWEQMEKRYAPDQYHYRKIFWGLIALFALFFFWTSHDHNK